MFGGVTSNGRKTRWRWEKKPNNQPASCGKIRKWIIYVCVCCLSIIYYIWPSSRHCSSASALCWPMEESKSHHITSNVNIPYIPKWFSLLSFFFSLFLFFSFELLLVLSVVYTCPVPSLYRFGSIRFDAIQCARANTHESPSLPYAHILPFYFVLSIV